MMKEFSELVRLRDMARTKEIRESGSYLFYTAEIGREKAEEIIANSKRVFEDPEKIIIFESGTAEQYTINELIQHSEVKSSHVRTAEAYDKKLGKWTLDHMNTPALNDLVFIWYETDDNDNIIEYYLINSNGLAHRIYTSPVVVYETHYCERSDMTIISKQSYYTQGIRQYSIISFYFGRPTEEVTRLYIEDPSLTADF